MSWIKSGKEKIWEDIISDIKNDILIIAFTKNIINAVSKGYIDDGHDLYRLALWTRSLLDINREDLSDLKKSDQNKINNIIKISDEIIEGTYIDDGTGLIQACNILNDIIGSSLYTLDTEKLNISVAQYVK